MPIFINNTPFSVLKSIIEDKIIIAARLIEIYIDGDNAHPLILQSENEIPDNDAMQLATTLKSNSKGKLLYAGPSTHKICLGNRYTIEFISKNKINNEPIICIKRTNRSFLFDANFAKRGITKVEMIILKIESRIVNLPSAPNCATKVVLPKTEIIQMVI
jgi:hypothetical protein